MQTFLCPASRCPLLVGGLLCALLGGVGCKELTGSPGLPAGTPDPSTYNNAAGAVGMRNAAVWELEFSIPAYLQAAGLLTDELEDPATGASAGLLLQNQGHIGDPVDERIVPEGANTGAVNQDLETTRTYLLQALGALAAYDTAKTDTAAAKVLRGELYAFLGYDEILLADLFCSGVPLSTIDFQKDFTYAPSSTTAQVYQDALMKLDTALRLAQASDSVVHLAEVLKGRAYVALGNYPAAADDVSTVPSGFTYQLFVGFSLDQGGGADIGAGSFPFNDGATVSNLEGQNGLNFRLSGDPRTATVTEGVNVQSGNTLFFPAKYALSFTPGGYAPFILASGVEARLIQAEAALNGVATGQGSWLDQLNALRADPANLARVTNHTSQAGTTLSDITDPGTLPGRVALLFRERAFWLFLDGHRQGDLRRLIREYGNKQSIAAFQTSAQVYPTGTYLAPGAGTYGTDVTLPLTNESPNPLFHGCLDRNP